MNTALLEFMAIAACGGVCGTLIFHIFDRKFFG